MAKEEIFLEISAEKMSLYYNDLLSTFPEGNNFTKEVIAEVWAGIINANQDYMRYVSYLNPIIAGRCLQNPAGRAFLMLHQMLSAVTKIPWFRKPSSK